MVVLMLVTVMRPLLPTITYALGKEYIAGQLCVNKNKPQLRCNGKCFLMKRQKEMAESTQPDTSGSQSSRQILEEIVFAPSPDKGATILELPSTAKVMRGSYHFSMVSFAGDVDFPPPKTA
jgi:hypothetical protein